MNDITRCNVCGCIDEWNWDKLQMCCDFHDRVICKRCLREMCAWSTDDFFKPCALRWDMIDAPPADECIAELRSWIEEDIEAA